MVLLELLKARGIELREISPNEAAAESTTKNLLLKDKRNRIFLISCKQSTNLDLKALSIRLGVGKGGLRFAPEENVQELFKVPPVFVSPLVLTADAPSSAVLLLDAKFQTSTQLVFPVSREVSIAVSQASLDQFLESIGKVPIYVDLEAPLQAGKDQADLSVYLPSKQETAPIEAAANGTESESKKPTAVPAVRKSKESNAAPRRHEPERRTEFASVEAMSSLILSTIASKSDDNPARLKSELDNLLVMFKNTAYTEGYVAASSAFKRSL